MIIVHKNMDARFDVRNDAINFLVIEDCKLYESVIIDVDKSIKQESDVIAIYDDDKLVDMKKSCELISTTLDLKYDRKAIQKTLYDALRAEMDFYEMNFAISEAYGVLLDSMKQLEFQCNFDIEYKEEDFDTFKIFEVHLKDPEGTFLEKVIDYITNVHKLIKKYVFFIVNCGSFLCDDDYLHIEKLSEHLGIVVIFIDNEHIVLKKSCNEYIIDMDLCEMHEEYL